MERRGLVCLIGLLFLMSYGARAYGQLSVGYHLHDQQSGSSYLLDRYVPTVAATSLTWTLPNCSGCDSYPVDFMSQASHPFAIAAGGTATFYIWLAVDSSRNGTYYPWAQVDSVDVRGISVTLCAATGTTPVTTTLTRYTLSCTTQTAVEAYGNIHLYAGLYQSAGPGHHNVSGELGLEGVTNGVNDSYVVIPPPPSPVITSITPNSGTIGSPVTINGRYFNATVQINNSLIGSASVSFNGQLPNSGTFLSDGTIKNTVRSGTTTGPVVVTVNGVQSNSVNFTVAPGITGLSPSSGSIGTAVTINGSGLGDSQGASSVTFNGIASTPTNWSSTQVVTPVPAGATTGPVVVTVASIPSSPAPFTVLGALSGSVTDSGSGSGVSGALVEILQSSVVKASTDTAADGSYSVSNLPDGNYDVRISASSYGTDILKAESVTSGNTTTANASLTASGTISGQVTQSDGVTPISGASVTAAEGDDSAGSATTDSNGNYLIPTLAAGSYTVVATATGYTAQSSGGVSVTGGTVTTQNFSLGTGSQSNVSYFYDELGRLTGVSDPQSNTATYNYDSVGNILSISVNSSSQVSIVGFDPASGPGGTTVTISGTGFSSTPSQDTVTFNGTAATVTSASTTQLVTTVPAGATTGPIRVTAPGGSATSSSSFTVQ